MNICEIYLKSNIMEIWIFRNVDYYRISFEIVLEKSMYAKFRKMTLNIPPSIVTAGKVYFLLIFQ